jgi:hypothetical protein
MDSCNEEIIVQAVPETASLSARMVRPFLHIQGLRLKATKEAAYLPTSQASIFYFEIPGRLGIINRL